MFYTRLFDTLDRHQVQYLLVGGLAVSLHGIERATMDVDITIAMTPANLAALVGAAKELELTPVLPVPLESLGDLDQLRLWHDERNLKAFALRTQEIAGVTLDVVLFPSVDFTGMNARAIIFKVGSVGIRVASIDDLIDLKKAAGRPIDLADIAHLERIKPHE